MELRPFYFHHPQLFIVPVEHLGTSGVSTEYAKLAEKERGLGPDFFALMSEAIAKPFERQRPLFAKARGQWFMREAHPKRRPRITLLESARYAGARQRALCR